ncbi:MAG TPA: hypothetical protein DD640_09045, partial [Clostridiales bacterium]|nr:hypothetical protein [Clostridiales bacterium]
QSWVKNFDTEAAITGKETDLAARIARAELSPIGKIQKCAIDLIRREGRPGAYYAPLAILMDFHCGWNPPRHLYTDQIYKVWGDLPYEDGDYQAHALFSLIYPGYENAGFYRDERGFLTATPYGDIADVLLSDTAPEILQNYELCVVLSSISLSLEMLSALRSFLRSGGHILLFDGELAQSLLAQYGLPGHKPGTWPADAGRITLLSRGNGLVSSCEPAGKDNKPNEPIAMPLDFSPEIKAAIAAALDELALIRPNNRSLQYSIALRRQGNELLCLVANNNARDIIFSFEPAACRIQSCREIPIDDAVSGEEGYLPDVLIPAVTNQAAPDPVGKGQYRIAAADVRLFALDISGSELVIREPYLPAERDRRLMLRLPSSAGSIREYLLAHPTLQQHFAGLMVDARYMETISDDQAAYEAAYIRRQGLRVIVDAVQLCNHYPDYTLSASVEGRRLATIRRLDRALRIASLYGCKDFILSLTQQAEQNQTMEELRESTEATLRDLSARAGENGIKIHLLRTAEVIKAAPRWDEWSDVVSLSAEPDGNNDYADGNNGNITGLLISSPFVDRFGQFYPVQKPVAGSALANQIAGQIKSMPVENLDFVVLAAEYQNWDEVYADWQWYKSIVK